MGLDHDLIKKVIQKDVNNYIIVMDNGKIKSKGAYVKSLNSLDYDLPIVNKALMEYFISGMPVEETINNCNDLIEFQKVVKVSSKYKLKKDKDTKDKIGGTPERCFIENGDIKGIKVPRKLDKQWYIDTAKKRIKDFVGEV